MSDNNITSPHDRYFRLMMSDTRVVKDFFEQYLPANIKSIINFYTINPQKSSFVCDDLKQQIADLLFSVEFDNRSGYLYVLLEHQSTPDKLMAFRILKYMIAIMEQHLKKTGKSKLPPIYPLIFYSGWRNYNYSTDIFDLFGDDKSLAMDILYKPYQLVNLSKISDEKLRKRLLHGVFARTMKHANEKNTAAFVSKLKDIIKDLEQVKNIGGIEYIYATLSYIVEAYDVPEQKFTEIVKENLTFIDERNIMTIAEQYRQKGLKEGCRKGQLDGIEKGIERGKFEALKAIAMKLFGQGMTAAQIASVTSLSANELETLKNHSSN